jgi:hypothetical protein
VFDFFAGNAPALRQPYPSLAGVNRQREWSLNRDVIALTSVGLLVAFVQAA